MTRSVARSVNWRRHGLLLLLTLFYGETFIGRQILAVMIEPIKQEFSASDSQMGLISGLAFAAVFALLGLSAGQLADRTSRTRLLAFCALIWALATALCGLASGFYFLIAARMLVAVAEVPITSASMSLIADLYPPHKRAFAISCYSSAATFAAIIALGLGGFLITEFGWRQTFIWLSMPAVLISVFFFIFVTEPQRGFWDPSLSKKALSKGYSSKPQTAPPSVTSVMPPSLLATVSSLWQRPEFRLLVLSSALTTMGANAYGMWNTAFLVRSHGLSLKDAGILAGLIGGGSAAIGVLFGGYLADRGYKKSLPRHILTLPIIGHLLGIISLGLYLLWPAGSGLTVFAIQVPTAMFACALAGFFSVWWVGPCFSLLTTLVPGNQRAVAIACQTVLVTLLGIGLGPFAVGLLSDHLSDWLGLESLRYALLFCNVTTLISVVLLIRLRKIQLGTQVNTRLNPAAL